MSGGRYVATARLCAIAGLFRAQIATYVCALISMSQLSITLHRADYRCALAVQPHWNRTNCYAALPASSEARHKVTNGMGIGAIAGL